MFVENLTTKGFNQSLISTQVGVKRGKICLIVIGLEAPLLLVQMVAQCGVRLREGLFNYG
jgi:hypothetical protein